MFLFLLEKRNYRLVTLLNSDREPVTVLFAKSIVLFVRAIVEPASKVFNCPKVALPSVPPSETKNKSVNSNVSKLNRLHHQG